MLLEPDPKTLNHKDDRKTYDLKAIVSSDHTEWLCPIHYVYDYLPFAPDWLKPPPLSSNPFSSSHPLEAGIHNIPLDTQLANLPLHTGLTGPFLQNKYWRATAQSIKDFLRLFASDEKYGRIVLSNKKIVASLAEEQLEYSDVMDSWSRFAIYFWPEVNKHKALLLAQSFVLSFMLDDLWDNAPSESVEEGREYIVARLSAKDPCTAESTPLEQGLDRFRRDLLASDDEGGGDGGIEIIEALINWCHRAEPPSFGSIRELLDYRFVDVGCSFNFALTKFAIGSSTSQQHPLLLPLLRHIGDHLTIVNDLASYAKEKRDFAAGKSSAMINLVHMILQQAGLGYSDGKEDGRGGGGEEEEEPRAETTAKTMAYAWQLYTEDAIRSELEKLRRQDRVGAEEWKLVEGCLGTLKGHVLTSVVIASRTTALYLRVRVRRRFNHEFLEDIRARLNANVLMRTMPPPAKRRRLFDTKDPDAELHERRARNDKKLKSRFESIFEKYSKDFTGIGDIIDFEKDKIVVDNGHLWDMTDEKDAGSNHSSPFKINKDPLLERTSETSRSEKEIPDSQDYESDDNDPLGMYEDALATHIHNVRESVQSSFSGHRNNHVGRESANTHGTTNPRLNSRWVEPAWRVPLLPADRYIQNALPSPSPSIVDDSSRSPSPEGVSIWALPTRKRRGSALGGRAPCSAQHDSFRPSPKTSLLVKWTQEERELLLQLKTSGSPWAEIERRLPNRTPAAIHMFWCTLKKKSNESPTQGGNEPSDGLQSQNLEASGDMENIIIDDSMLSLQAMDVDAPQLAATPAPCLASSSDAEFDDDLASIMISDPKLKELSPPAPKDLVLCLDRIIPDSQDSEETTQVLEQNPEPQIDALISYKEPENELKDPNLPELSLTEPAASPSPLDCSSSPPLNASSSEALLSRLECLEKRNDQLESDRTALSASLTLTQCPGMQSDGLCELKERDNHTSSEGSLRDIAESTEHLGQGMDTSSCSGNESNAPSGCSDGCGTSVTTPISMPPLEELSDTRTDTAADPVVPPTGIVSHDHYAMHEVQGEKILSEVRSSPSRQNPHADILAQPNHATTDGNKSRSETTSVPQIFFRIEIPLLAGNSSENQVTSGDVVLEACFDERVINQEVQHASHVTPPPRNTPGALSAAQEESLRKIKPFSLILPTEDHYIQNQRQQRESRRHGQDETRIDAFQARVDGSQTMRSDQVTPSKTSTSIGRTGDDLSLGTENFANHGSEIGTPLAIELNPVQLSGVGEDEDVLQLNCQPKLASKFPRKSRQSCCGHKPSLAFRPKLDEDISDDELSTPIKMVWGRVERATVETPSADISRVSSAS
ncbi:MAG: hypothetical protein Q9169_002704 [Polycauliona sp. 2 TL-2023]